VSSNGRIGSRCSQAYAAHHPTVTSAGISGLPHVINACILIFTFSAANSDQYIASRTLYGMARDGHAPTIFARCTKRGVPYVAFMATGCFMGLAFLVASADALKIFNYFVSAVTMFGALTWISILSSFIAFQKAMKAQGISRDTLPYKAPLQVGAGYACLLMRSLLTFVNEISRTSVILDFSLRA
jgi:amino acid transporter